MEATGDFGGCCWSNGEKARMHKIKCLKDKEEKVANTGGYLKKLTGERTEKGLQWRMQNAGL